MKSKSTILLEDTPKEIIDAYASIRCEEFGQVILDSMGYNAECIWFGKCKEGGYNIGWALQRGDEFIKTFSFEEIAKAFCGKTLTITTEVTRGKSN